MFRARRAASERFMSRFLSALIFSFLLLNILPSSALAKDYRFSEVKIEATVERDGSFTVVEERSFLFDGSFSWASYTLPIGYRYDIENFSIEEKGTPFVRSDLGGAGSYQFDRLDDSVLAKWYFAAKDEERTFTIKYRIVGGIDVYSDLAQFYWKFVGDGWDKPTERFSATLKLPEGAAKESIRAWGHGPLTGVVDIVDGQSVVYEASDLPANTFVEGRVLFPKSLVAEAGQDYEGPILEEAIREETALAKEANRQREAAKADLEKRLQIEKMGLASSIVISFVGLLFFVILWFLFGKEYPPSFDQDYLRELPAEYPPAVMGYLINFGLVDGKEMVATIMDLARRGFMTIKEEEVEREILFMTKSDYDYVLTRQQSDKTPLNTYESNLLKFLFDEVGAKNSPVAFRSFFEGFKQEAQAAAKAHGFLERRGSVIALNVAVSFMLIGFGAFVISVFKIGYGLISIVVGFIQILLSFLLRRRSPEAALDFKKWEAFKRFLLHFSNLKEAPPSSMVIWEHYLVYAVVLGVADKVIEELKVVMPDLLKEEGIVYHGPAWFVSSRGLEGLGALESFGQSMSHMVAVANSAMSSGSGGGGGFSGGGGGGGGGSGGGAG